MKKYRVIKEVPFANGYVVEDHGNDDNLFVLGKFLRCEIVSEQSYNYFTSWLKEETHQNTIYGNVYGLEQKAGKVIIFDQYPIEKGKNLIFVTTNENLLQIINDWLIVLYQKSFPPLEVMIEQNEKGKITFTWLGKINNESKTNN